MAFKTFKNGDTVKLNSGGPIMTIDGNDGYGGVICQWFNKNEEIKKEVFNEESLTSYIEETTTISFD